VESIQDFAGKFFGLNILAGLLRIGCLQVVSYERFSGLICKFFRSGFQPQDAGDKSTVQKILTRRRSREAAKAVGYKGRGKPSPGGAEEKL
jgi:hypothetical protein